MTDPCFRALGMMSGTSLDGIDVALIETDGVDYIRPLSFATEPFNPSFRERLRACLGKAEGTDDFEVALVERELTLLHADLALRFLQDRGWGPEDIDLIGFHGQTLCHRPEEGVTVQIGDGAFLAEKTGIAVVNDFRTTDVRAGGQGAPLVPLYHRALMADLEKPVAIVNIGGVANLTWIGGENDEDLIAFDTGPGNALLDDWMLTRGDRPYDKDGAAAAAGRVDEDFVERFLGESYFSKRPPKSLDRDFFAPFVPDWLNLEDGAATLTMMTVRTIERGLRLLPALPRTLYLAGGGRNNVTLRQWLGEVTGILVGLVDVLGWNGDSMEAEAFAYLAVRSRLGLPLSVPGTTGVPYPLTGGVLHEAQQTQKRDLWAKIAS